ncbi:hypothetical protein GQ54DRAFT_331701 [Martensiomyces pterosporus]|nr:hypothetical protein GQ54DRAFT_331701 [Martensiomyces pterosporus]
MSTKLSIVLLALAIAVTADLENAAGHAQSGSGQAPQAAAAAPQAPAANYEVGYAPQTLVAAQQYEANRPKLHSGGSSEPANPQARAGEKSSGVESASSSKSSSSHNSMEEEESSASEHSSNSSKKNAGSSVYASLVYAVAAASIAGAWVGI